MIVSSCALEARKVKVLRLAWAGHGEGARGGEGGEWVGDDMMIMMMVMMMMVNGLRSRLWLLIGWGLRI
jgi:hypothetical protein